MGRTPCYNEAGLKKGAWTADEDHKLIAYIQEHGEGGWRTLPQKAGLQRCGKSCRLRWANYLRPDIRRGKFSTEEEQKIIQLHASLGNRWSAIARHLPKRTDNGIKNYWNTHLKKRLIDMGVDPITHKQIGPTSNGNSTDDIRPIQRSVSTSAKLLNKVSAKLAQIHWKDSSNGLDAIKKVLLNSTKDNNITLSGGCDGTNGDGNGGDDSDNEILASIPKVGRPISRSNSSRLINKVATKLVPSKGLDLIKERLGATTSNQSLASISVSDASIAGISSYNNIESPISISEYLEDIPTLSSKCDSYESTRNLGNVREDEVNEAFAVLLQTMSPCELEDYLGNYGGEDGGTLLTNNNLSQNEDVQVDISSAQNSNFIEQVSDMPFGGGYVSAYNYDERFNSRDYYNGEGESSGGGLDVSLNYWNDDFDLGNYAIQ
ncbi:hypothetical protein JCGZ_11650 [Jatropha curcas]|uniref:MYB family protein n=1 Tax=Jatropha curcas TaxID=180498 RepID=A0A067KHI0_JATCU|nr:transcription factor MYB28 [Jatropha curcas]AIT52291.1 MYB family protein [Jatropha curcas]KDP31274.1 hypothetical protein JCGZ_11650 [Jatropha curcas]